MNWLLVIIIGSVLLGLIIFLVIRNQKDEKSFEHQLNEDYHKSKEEIDTDPEEFPE